MNLFNLTPQSNYGFKPITYIYDIIRDPPSIPPLPLCWET